jgi:hypothetical protein
MQTQTTSTLKTISNKVFMLIFSMILSIAALAQETKKVDVNISTDGDGGGGSFFASPWVWVVGVAVFILLLVALLRGGGRREV